MPEYNVKQELRKRLLEMKSSIEAHIKHIDHNNMIGMIATACDMASYSAQVTAYCLDIAKTYQQENK